MKVKWDILKNSYIPVFILVYVDHFMDPTVNFLGELNTFLYSPPVTQTDCFLIQQNITGKNTDRSLNKLVNK